MPPVFSWLTLGLRPPGSSTYRPNNIVYDRWYVLPLIPSRYINPFRSCQQKVISGSKCPVHFFFRLLKDPLPLIPCRYNNPFKSYEQKVITESTLKKKNSNMKQTPHLETKLFAILNFSVSHTVTEMTERGPSRKKNNRKTNILFSSVFSIFCTLSRREGTVAPSTFSFTCVILGIDFPFILRPNVNLSIPRLLWERPNMWCAESP